MTASDIAKVGLYALGGVLLYQFANKGMDKLFGKEEAISPATIHAIPSGSVGIPKSSPSYIKEVLNQNGSGKVILQTPEGTREVWKEDITVTDSGIMQVNKEPLIDLRDSLKNPNAPFLDIPRFLEWLGITKENPLIDLRPNVAVPTNYTPINYTPVPQKEVTTIKKSSGSSSSSSSSKPLSNLSDATKKSLKSYANSQGVGNIFSKILG